MAQAWRIAKEKRAATAFTGEGAARYGGRWNSRGVWVVYTSGSLALAVLENLVHLNPMVRFRYVAIGVRFPTSLIERLPAASLPGRWRESPPSAATQRIGDEWVRDGRSAVLEVPSAVVPGEQNYLLNPAHPDFKAITIGKPEPFAFDQRLLT